MRLDVLRLCLAGGSTSVGTLGFQTIQNTSEAVNGTKLEFYQP